MEGQPGTNYFGKLKKFVNISQTNELGHGVIADCFGDPNVLAVDAGIFNNGCIMFRNDILTGSSIYQNTGTLANPSWSLISGGGSTINFVDSEIVSGSGISWVLANIPIIGSVHLFGGGSRLTPGTTLTNPLTDYVITGENITTQNSYAAGQILADYRD